MSDDKVTISLDYTFTKDELWSMICGAAWEEWDWWKGWQYKDGDWDKACTLIIDCEDPNSNKIMTTEVTVDDLVKAIHKLEDHKTVMECLRNDDFDAVYSDCVMQTAVYGEVVYG